MVCMSVIIYIYVHICYFCSVDSACLKYCNPGVSADTSVHSICIKSASALSPCCCISVTTDITVNHLTAPVCQTVTTDSAVNHLTAPVCQTVTTDTAVNHLTAPVCQTVKSDIAVNRLTAPVCQISGLKVCTHMPANSIFSGCMTNLLLQYISQSYDQPTFDTVHFEGILSHANNATQKEEGKGGEGGGKKGCRF